MDALTLALITGLGWTSGLRFYAVLFFLGLLHRGGVYALPGQLDMLAHPWVMGISGLLFVTEFFADKIPGVDTLWDTVHTFIRIPGGALLAAGAVAGGDPGLALAAGLLGGTVAAERAFHQGRQPRADQHLAGTVQQLDRLVQRRRAVTGRLVDGAAVSAAVSRITRAVRADRAVAAAETVARRAACCRHGLAHPRPRLRQ